jgi:hypothetical protein
MSSRPSSLGRRKRSPTKRSSESPSKSTATPNTTSTRSTGPYDRAFQQHLIDHQIFPDGYEYPDGRSPPEPKNLDDISDVLAQPRASLSPSRFSNDDFRKFKRADTHASKEREVTTTVIPIIEGNVGDTKCAAGEIPFANLDHLTDGTLVPGNPDLYYGARPEQIDRNIRSKLEGQIVPSTQHDLPVAPNFFLAVKGPDGSLSVAARQASYDGALGARAIHSLQSFESEPRYDNNAHTITSLYHGGQLKMYTSHPIQPSIPGGRPGYVTTQIRTFGLTGDADTFRKGAAAFRNGRDWAKKQRDDAIKQANERSIWRTAVASSQGNDSPRPSGTDEASADETIGTSQQTILNFDVNLPRPSSDTSEDELSRDFHPLKRPRSHSPRKNQGQPT